MGSAVQPSQQSWTVQRLLNWTREHFERNNLEDPRLCAEVLLAHALKWERIQLYVRHDTLPEGESLDTFRESVKRAANGVPIAYLVGQKEFYSLTFEVSAAVLVPRPETETLVDEVIKVIRDGGGEGRTMLDLGTGSGCIAVAVASRIPGLRVVATDVSPEALTVARRNVEKHEMKDQITTAEADGLDISQELVPNGGFDVIVSNPPYVAEGDKEMLARNVRDHEPAVALFAGSDGLRFFRMLADGSGALLKSNGSLLVEIGQGQAESIRGFSTEAGGWNHVRTVKDQVEGHERVMVFQKVAVAV